MAVKFIIAYLCVLEIATEATATSKCPSRWEGYPHTCLKVPGRRCRTDYNCQSDQVCCRVGYCGKRCRDSRTPAVQQIAATGIDGGAARVATTNNVVNSGRCNASRRIRCQGTSCSGDGDCLSNQKCCINQCGNRVCSGALRSSSLFRFQNGK